MLDRALSRRLLSSFIHLNHVTPCSAALRLHPTLPSNQIISRCIHSNLEDADPPKILITGSIMM